MRLPLLLALMASCSAPVLAQTATAPAAATTAALPDFDTQQKVLAAPRIGTLAELQDQGRALLGKTVELRGVVKANFSGSAGVSLLLQLPDGQSQSITGTPSFQDLPMLRTGNWVRVLCRVQALIGAEAVLQLVNVTAKRDSASDANDSASFSSPEDLPGTSRQSDISIGIGIGTPNVSSDGVVIGPEVELPPPPSRSFVPPTIAPRQVAPPTSTPPSPTRGNSFYGFDSSSRQAFKSLAMRTNPRLDEGSADNIAASLLEAAQTQNLDPRFLAAIVQVESEFNPYAVSNAGARGLGQLMPFNLSSLGVANAWDPRQNLHGAAKLLRQNLNVYARDRNGTMLAVAAYHAGVGAVNRAGRAIPKAATQRYVWKVYYAYKALAPELFR